MKTYKDLNSREKNIVNKISDEAYDLIKSNAIGIEFIRINMYEDSIKEFIKNGETDKELCGAHFFSNSQWDDIDKLNQIEIMNFDQDLMNWCEGDGEWYDSTTGQNWLNDMCESAKQNIISYLFENKLLLESVSSLDEAIKIVNETKESQSFVIEQNENFSIEIFVVYDSCEVEEGEYESFARLESCEPSEYCKQYLITEDTDAGYFFYNKAENAGNCYKLADGKLTIEESIKLFFTDAIKLSFITEENGYYESSHYYFSKSESKKLSDINLFEELNLSIDSDIEKKYKLSIDNDFNTFINSIIISTIENNGDLNDIEYIANDSIDQLAKPVFYIKGGFQKAIQTAKNEGEVTIYEIKYCNLAKECNCSGQLMFTNAAWSTSKESLEEELQRWIEGSEGKDCGYDITDVEIDFIEEIEKN